MVQVQDDNYKQSDTIFTTTSGPRTPSNDVWQLCPKCNGTGEMWITNFGYVVSTNANCDVCWGKKIISTITGQPPQ